MSDARTDFFATGAAKAPPLATREDFFAGKVDVDGKSAANASAPKVDWAQPYAYYSPEGQRALGNTGEDLQPIVGAGEAALQVGTGAVSTAAAGIAGLTNFGWNHSPIGILAHKLGVPELESADVVRDIQGGGTYQPRTEAGEISSDAVGAAFDPDRGSSWLNPLAIPGNIGTFLGDKSNELGAPPLVSAALRVAPDAATAMFAPKVLRAAERAPPKAVPSPQDLLNQAASKGSMGAAGSAVDLQKLSPDLRVAVEKAVQKTGGAVNPDVLAREVQADSLPVKVHLSEGQKLGDARMISEERNARGKTPGFVEGFAAQNKALTDNLRAFRDTAGEDVFSTNATEHADTLIGRYKALHEQAEAETAAKYQALRDAAGGEFPVDTGSLLNNVRGALKKDMASSKAPSDVMTFLEEKAAAGGMTLEDFETMRSTLARIQRSAADGQERYAAGVIRRQVEEMPMAPSAAHLKGLADDARAAARSEFQRQEADPAYKAAVHDTVPPDKFVQKFVIGGTRDNVAKLSAAMQGDGTAAQTLKVAALDHLRQAAGIDAGFNGNFTQAGYNKALRGLESKLGSLLDPALAEHVRNLGDVARYSQIQPEGHFVNNSNSTVAAQAMKHGADILEGAANVKAGGVPVGTWVRSNITDRAGRKAAAKTFAPGSGLTRLSDLAKLKEPK